MNPEQASSPALPEDPGETRTLEIAATAAQVDSAVTMTEKSNVLWAMPKDIRHEVLGTLAPSLIATLIESDPEKNTALLGSVPSDKFQQILNLGSPVQGRGWLERAVESGQLAATFLPSLLNANQLANMLLTAPDVRRALPKLLNFDRTGRWRNLLTPAEWHANMEHLLMSDAEELLEKASFKSNSVKSVLRSVLDYVPELYLETIRLAMDRAKHSEDNPDEEQDIASTPFALPEIFPEGARIETATLHGQEGEQSSLADLMPDSADPVFALATVGLPEARRRQLETELRQLFREEIVSTASFSQAAMERAAGRVLFYLRAGLATFGNDIHDATVALQTQDLHRVSMLGTRSAEGYRQKALALAGLRDWLDGRQKQFLESMKSPEAGLHPETREPVFWLAPRPKVERSEWHPTPLGEIAARLTEIATWGPLARAAFETPERVHAIYMSAKTRTAEEALWRTILALVLYRRWEPELIRPDEDYPDFYRKYPAGPTMDPVRQTILDALEASPDELWKPSDAKARARSLMLKSIDVLEADRPHDSTPNSRARRGHG